MKAYQIFQSISPGLAASIFQTLRDEQKDIYKSTLVSLAAQKRLRPVFIQRKPVDQQITWMCATSRLKAADSVTENVLQLWLLKTQKNMLIQFLDGLGIEHDDEGTVEDLPEKLDAKKLKSTVDDLLKTIPAETVAVYLNMFQMQQPGGWEELKQLLESDERLYLGSGKKVEEAKAEPVEEAAAAAAASAPEEAPSAEKEEA